MIYDDPVLGVDVSMHQPEFPWPKAVEAGMVFAWVKTSEGTGYTDPWWGRHATRAQASGILWGGYHFARANGSDWYLDAVNEADSFVDRGGMDGSIPGLLDMEHTDFGRDLTIRWAHAWCSRVKDKTGYEGRLPIYWGGWFVNEGREAPMNDSRLADCIWMFPSYGTNLANPNPIGQHIGWRGGYNGPRVPDIWQYTDKARIPGWSAGIDASIANRRTILEMAGLLTPAEPIREDTNVRSLMWARADSVWAKDIAGLPAPAGTQRHAFAQEGLDIMHLGTAVPETAHETNPVVGTQQYFARAAGREFTEVDDNLLRGHSFVPAHQRAPRFTLVVKGDGTQGRLKALLTGTPWESQATPHMAFHVCTTDFTAYVLSTDTQAPGGLDPVMRLAFIGVEVSEGLGDSFWSAVRLTGSDRLAV